MTDDLGPRFLEEVAVRGEFSADWFTRKVDQLEVVMTELENGSTRILEIGSFEGLSTCYFLWRLPQAVVTCVDTFEGTPGLPSGDRRGLEETFDRNVALVDPSRVRKLVGLSQSTLPALEDRGERFDLVYVDGSHLGLDVLIDAAFSWKIVAVGGFVVFDDYRWQMLGDDALRRPGPAIDAFVALLGAHAEILFRDRQVAIRRLS